MHNKRWVSTGVIGLVVIISISSPSSPQLMVASSLHANRTDSIIIYAESSPWNGTNEINGHPPHRVKRQFPSTFQFPFQNYQFPAGWPFQNQKPGGGPPSWNPGGGFPGFGFPTPAPAPTQTTSTMGTTSTSTRPSGNCRTRGGLLGRCATFRSCYPIFFNSLNEGEEVFRNPGLLEDLKERSGKCEGPPTSIPSRYLTFRADVELRNNMICCGETDEPKPLPTSPSKPPSSPINTGFFPQITNRPPWAVWSTSTTTSTTTRRPSTTTTPRPPTIRTSTTPQSLWPNWPPPFITHPPSHFPSWVFSTQGSSGTTTTTSRPTTSKAPMIVAQWPPPLPTSPPIQRPHPPMGTTPATVTQPPVSSSCGYSKIVGGQQATKGEFPWLVAIMRHGRQICGGSLLDTQWVLTAAHCFHLFQPHDVAGLRVQIGDYDIYSNSDGPVTIRGVSKLIKHGQFSMSILHNDIALLKLDSPVQLGNNGNNNIQPICLVQSSGYDGSTVTVAGWGGIYEGGPQPPIYKKVNLQVWSNQQCASKYGQRAPGGITSQMVCAGSPQSDACRGDSGGPLMRNQGGRWEQIGIVSWGIGCGSYPGVYTRVDKYQSWIAMHRQY